MLSLLIKSNVDVTSSLISVLALVIVAILSIMLHEFAHGWVALLCGDNTAKINGRLNLNPLKHFDLVGMLLILVIGFGWAKPVPINPNNFKKRKSGIFWVSIAGILVNLFLALVFFALLNLLAFWFSSLTVVTGPSNLVMLFVYSFCLYGLIVNVSLAAFNILPICPLDGFRVIEAIWPQSAYCRFMRKYGMIILLVIIAISFTLGRFLWYLDFIGLYLSAIQNSVINLLFKTWGAFL